MNTIKEITEKFEATRGTLHNWKTTKPKLYEYLLNSDDQYEKYREVNILLESYIKTAKDIELFDYKEVEYIFFFKFRFKRFEKYRKFASYIHK